MVKVAKQTMIMYVFSEVIPVQILVAFRGVVRTERKFTASLGLDPREIEKYEDSFRKFLKEMRFNLANVNVLTLSGRTD